MAKEADLREAEAQLEEDKAWESNTAAEVVWAYVAKEDGSTAAWSEEAEIQKSDTAAEVVWAAAAVEMHLSLYIFTQQCSLFVFVDYL